MKRTWYTLTQIKEEHKDLPIRQIYVWFITKDDQLVIVGKHNKFQFPGGKPENGESQMDTIQRELWEEAGLVVDNYKEKPQLFGYYLIEDEVNEHWHGEPFLQIRYFMKVSMLASEIHLSVNEREADTDKLDEAKFVPLRELPEHIPWVEGIEEYEWAKNLA